MKTVRSSRRALAAGACVGACALAVTGAFLCNPQTAEAKSSAKELRIGMPNGVKYAKSTFGVDLSHDGRADAVKVVPVMKHTMSGSHGIRVYVRGHKALSLNAKTGSARFSLYYVHMSKKLEFLAIAQPRGKKDAFTPGKLVLYKYAKKKLVQVADLSQKWGVLGRPSHTAVKSAGKKSITVTATFEKSPLGARSFPLVYGYDRSSREFELASKSARPVIAPRHWTASVKRTLYKRAAPQKIKVVRTVIEDPAPESGAEPVTASKTTYQKNKKVATMKKGAEVAGVRVHRDGYMRVTLRNGKSGWFKWAKYRKHSPFKEVGAGYRW